MSGVVIGSLAEALGRGWSVLPCGGNKKPLIKKWKPFQTRRPTEQEVSNWASLDPVAWAIITGAISGLVTLDFDGQAGRDQLASLGIEPHRKTPSGGFHVDFKHPGWRVSTLNHKTKRELGRRWPGLDIRADGGYVLFTGRIERGEYVWLRDPEPYELDILPEDLRDFLGLLKSPESITPKANLTGNPQPRQGGRVDAELLTRRALDHAPAEGRNNTGFWLAVQLRDNGYSQLETEDIMRRYTALVGNTNTKGMAEPYREAEALATVREVFSRSAREPWEAKRPNSGSTTRAALTSMDATKSPIVPDLAQFLPNDHGNACRLIALSGDDVKFCRPLKKWLVWDGMRWAIDETGQVCRLAKEAMLEFLRQAIHAENEPAAKFARASLDARRIASMLSMAESEIFVRPCELDQNPDLLNFKNGTVDLRTGELRQHDRADLITKLVHYEYLPQAKCPRWQTFLDQVMGGGPDASGGALGRAKRMVEYLQRALGYSLTGRTIEKAVFVLFGEGDNGKSTMLSTVRQLIEEYSVLLQVDTLMVRQESNNTQADLADLRGARFVQTSETEEGQRLAQGKLKRITQGMGKIKAARKYENPIEFAETHKLWMDTNRKPTIRDADDKATFNRLHPIPFVVRIPREQIDRDLPAKLLREAEGILAWAVQGAKRWHESGLNRPPEVEAARDQWQSEEDQLGSFIAARCIHGDSLRTPAEALYATYKSWAETGGERDVMSAKAFGMKMPDRGFRKKGTNRGNVYLGIGLKSSEVEGG